MRPLFDAWLGSVRGTANADREVDISVVAERYTFTRPNVPAVVKHLKACRENAQAR